MNQGERTMRIGVAGLGRMGTAMALRLIDTGHTVSVWNRTESRVAPLVAAGATACATPKALAEAVEVLITMMFDKKALDATFGGESGVLAADLAGRLVIEMSTVRPIVEQELAAAVVKSGGAFIECPVGGTVTPARNGKLLGLVGGAEADFERARPVLEQLCRRVVHCGPVGAGASMKLAVNLPLAVYWQALGEAHALVKHLGRDAAWFMDVMGDTSGAPNALQVRGHAVVDALAGGTGGPTAFSLEGIAKDLNTMLAEAASLGFTLPVTSRAAHAYNEAVGSGIGDRDAASMPAYWGSRPAATALTLDVANTIVHVALGKGQAMGLQPLTVAVLDAGGHLVAFQRSDNSGILRFDIAYGKAWGALGMGFGSRELFQRAQGNPSFIAAIGMASGGRVVPVPGGVLIRNAAGALLGAVGISGDVSDADEACALAGIAAVGLVAQTGA